MSVRELTRVEPTKTRFMDLWAPQCFFYFIFLILQRNRLNIILNKLMDYSCSDQTGLYCFTTQQVYNTAFIIALRCFGDVACTS